MTWTSPPGAYGAADPLFLLLIALAVEAYIGGRPVRLPWLPNPRRAVARPAGELERRLNRPERSAGARRVRGALVVLVLALLALAAGWLAEVITRYYPFAWVLELILLVLLLEQRRTWRRGAAVEQALRQGSVNRAREALRPLAADRLDGAAVEALPEALLPETTVAALGRRFAVRLVGPILWYVLLGLPGLFLQQTSLVLGVLLGRRGAFGLAAARFDRLVALPGHYVGVLLLALAAAFVPGGRPLATLRCAPTARGGPEAAIAAATGSPAPGAKLGRALAVFTVACLVQVAFLGLLALVRLAV